MSSKLGPRFALQLKVEAHWSLHLASQDMALVMISAAGEAFQVEIPSEALREHLKRSDIYTWIFLAQILREDEEIWYGFGSPVERLLFEELKEIPGIGPKTTALLIGNLGLKSLKQLLLGENPALFKVPGIGPKTMVKVAQGLQNDKERFLKFLSSSGTGGPEHSANTSLSLKTAMQGVENIDPEVSRAALSPAIIKALERLGLNLNEVLELYREVLSEGDLDKVSEPDLIRMLIQRWGLWRSRAKGDSPR
jgi:Holliday junction resolvasome RuvABC DNA-binding subunit